MMNKRNQRNGINAFYGKLLSMFDSKIKGRDSGEAVIKVSAPVVKPAIIPMAAAQGRKVLIADDDPVFARATATILKAHGFDVTTAGEGSEVLKVAREEDPDAILLDIDFPPELPTSWDGFTILEWLNQAGWSSKIAVIMCTSQQDPLILDRAKAGRVAGVLPKPIDYGALLDLLTDQKPPQSFGAPN